jgi:DNA ligase-associated metallophosphoesterase
MTAALRVDETPDMVRTVEFDLNGTRVACGHEGVLYMPDSGILVVSDLHLEKGAAFARRGMLLPPYDTAATLARLGAALLRFRPKGVVSLGDSFHDRKGSAHLPPAYRDALRELQAGRDWMWIEGNHDPDAPVGLPGEFHAEIYAETLVMRHEPAKGPAPGEIAGHLHPAARVVRRGKGVRRACFACDGARLVMPAFGTTTGTLELRHPALRSLFDHAALMAHMIGRDRIYSVAYQRLNN